MWRKKERLWQKNKKNNNKKKGKLIGEVLQQTAEMLRLKNHPLVLSERQLWSGQGRRSPSGGRVPADREEKESFFLPSLKLEWILINTLCQLLIAFAACC